MAEQIIIAIGREFGSGGHAIGEKIAKDLGIEFVDRKMLDEIAEENRFLKIGIYILLNENG